MARNRPRRPNRRVRVGVFDEVTLARAAVEAARRAGFGRIEVVASDELRGQFGELGVEPNAAIGWRGLIVGASVGVIVAALLQKLVPQGDAGGVIGGLLLIVILGVFGGFVGVMATRGATDEARDFYDQELESGQVLVAIHVPERDPSGRLEEADRILAEAGANLVLPLRED
jgi:hypothetical protein